MGKKALFMCVYGLNSHLKCSFKSILEKKHQYFFLRSPFWYVCHTLKIYRSAPIPKNLPCPEKFLVVRLYVLVSYSISLIWLNYTKDTFYNILNLLNFAKHALIKEFQWVKGKNYQDFLQWGARSFSYNS